jgi:POT family proton-dependent oligopeptide transporter
MVRNCAGNKYNGANVTTAYTKAPTSMKSFIMSMFLLTNAFGAALGAAISPFAKDPNLTWMYTGLAGGSLIAGFAFWFLFQKYNAAEDSLNDLDRPLRLETVPALPPTYKVSKFDLNSLYRASESGQREGNSNNKVNQGV